LQSGSSLLQKKAPKQRKLVRSQQPLTFAKKAFGYLNEQSRKAALPFVLYLRDEYC